MKNKISNNLQHIMNDLGAKVHLVAVTKNQNIEDVKRLYDCGVRDFGENRVQDLLFKRELLAHDIKWHLIGHLQTNKVKFIAPFIHLIHSVDNEKLLKEIDKQAAKCKRIINYLLQIHVAEEESKFGFSLDETTTFIDEKKQLKYPNTKLCGIMGMATNTNDTEQIRTELNTLRNVYNNYKENPLEILCMGMSSDYKIAIACGSNMVRIGSALFLK